MGTSSGAEDHSLFGTILHPALQLSESYTESDVSDIRLELSVIEDSLGISLDKNVKIVVQ